MYLSTRKNDVNQLKITVKLYLVWSDKEKYNINKSNACLIDNTLDSRLMHNGGLSYIYACILNKSKNQLGNEIQ